MATSTLGEQATTAAWVNVVTAYASAASVNALIQNTGSQPVGVVWGGASAPVNMRGVVLEPLDSVQGNAANIWVKTLCNEPGAVSVTVL